jgi:hypothetical protein
MMETGGDQNPPPDVILELVKAARASGASSRVRGKNADLSNLGQVKLDGDKKEVDAFFSSHKDNPDGYPGFYPGHDKTAMSLMEAVGCSASMSDIIVVPGTAGMTISPGSNPAVALMTEDKVALFRKIAVTDYGPGQFTDSAPHYGALIERFQIGTIVIAESLLGDDLRLKGTIWHECGHKVLGIKEETGAVFHFEISKLRTAFDDKEVLRWATDVGRKPDYHRTYGLAHDPGRKDLLLELKAICPERFFYDEFRKQYEEIMEQPLALSNEFAGALQSEKEERDARRKPVEIGTVITGDLAALQAQVPEVDLQGARRTVRPLAANAGELVTFAGKQWLVRDKQEAQGKAVLTLECTATELEQKISQNGDVWQMSSGGASSYGLTANGPWIYTRGLTAMNDMRMITEITEKTMIDFPKANRETVYRLVFEQVLKTAEEK